MEVVGLAVSAAIAALIAPGALRAFSEAGWMRPNYRSKELPFPAGAVAVAAGIVTLGALAVAQHAGLEALSEPFEGAYFNRSVGSPAYAGSGGEGPAPWLALFLGVAFLGLLDDVFDGPPRGLRGHAKAILRGGFSTGALKAVGTLALAALVIEGHDLPTWDSLLAIAVIVLATNMFNLLDLRPGRSVKVFVLLGSGLLIGTGDSEPLRIVGPFAGALLVLGLYDLRERAMLGDTGSNLLGALAGVWIVTSLSTTSQLIAAAVLLALTIFGEFRSISKTIERVPPLRVLDSLGRPD